MLEQPEHTTCLTSSWNTESIGIIEPDQVTTREFPQDVKFIKESQRYQVSAPWKEEGPQIASGYSSDAESWYFINCKAVSLREIRTERATDHGLLKDSMWTVSSDRSTENDQAIEIYKSRMRS